MAKIVIDARELRTSTGRYVERLLYYLQNVDKKNEYLVLLKPADFDSWEPASPNFKKILCPYKEFTFGEQLGFAWQLYSLKANLVHFGMTHQPIMYLKKTVTTVHDLTTVRFRNPAKNWAVFKFKQWVYRGVVWIVAHKSERIITPSEFVKQDLAHYAKIRLSKIAVTNEAADRIEEKPEPIKELEGKDFLLYVGRALPHKNLKVAVDAFQEVKWNHPGLRLVFAGKVDANYRKLEAYAKSKKVADVVFTDFVTDPQLRWLYEKSRAYVFPSLSEGFGLPGLEAMLYDLPVLSSRATCLPEIYKDAAIYFDPKSSKDLALKMQQLLDDPELAKKMAAAGRKLVKQYSWQKMAEETHEIYLKILNK